MLVLLLVPARGGAEDEAGGLRAGLERFGLSGSLAFDYYSSNHGIDDREHFLGTNLVLKQRLTVAEGVRWVGEARVLAQQVGHEDEDAPHGSIRSLRYSDEVTSELREGYVEVARERWELRGGRQIVTWGRADELNPTDVITPKNFLLLLPEGQAAYRFGVNALKLDAFLPESVRLTGVWVPIFSPSIIPIAELPDGVRLFERLPAVRFEDGSAGVKLDRSGGKIDASLAYFYGFNLLPEAHVERVALDAVTQALTGDVALVYGRQHMIGADFATTRGRWGYRGEVAWVHTDNPNGRSVESIVPYLYYVLGHRAQLLHQLQRHRAVHRALGTRARRPGARALRPRPGARPGALPRGARDLRDQPAARHRAERVVAPPRQEILE